MDTSTPATCPPTSVAVPVSVTWLPLAIEAPTAGETIETVGPVVSVDDLAQRILNGLAQPGVHRALFDLKTWTLLKWLDEPCSFYDWRGGDTDQQRVHPDDEPVM